MSNATTEAIGAALAYYTTPTTTRSVASSIANLIKNEDGYIDAAQTVGEFVEMLGKQLPSLAKALPGGAVT